MKIVDFVCGPLENNCSLLLHDTAAYLIDAPFGSFDAVEGELEKHNAVLKGVLMTHGHWDHMGDLKKFQEEGAQVYAHPASAPFIHNPEAQRAYSIPGIVLHPARIDRELMEGESLEILGTTIEVLHVPGHSDGSVVLYLPSQGLAFVGDVLFYNSIGRTDLPGGNHQLLLQGIASKLYTLPESTRVYPGHGPSTSIGYEKQHNPFVKG